MKFCLFRELDLDFDLESALDTNALRMQAADAIDGQPSDTHPGLLADALEPFLKSVRFPFQGPGNPALDEGDNIARNPKADAVYDPILLDPAKSANGIKAILRYIDDQGCFHIMDEENYGNVLNSFSPIKAVHDRTNSIIQRLGPDAKNYAVDDFALRDLVQRNEHFERLAGPNSHMNAVFIHGPTAYQYFFPLIREWLEADWHGIRYKAYDASACLYSTSWEPKKVFDFDANPKAFYQEAGHIDDSRHFAQKQFGELDWGILLDVVSDDRWALAVRKIRYARNPEAASAAADELLNFLAKRIVDFKFELINGRISVFSKVVAGAAVCASLISAGLGHFESSLLSLTGAGPTIFGSVAASFESAGKLGKAPAVIAAMVPGAQWYWKHHKGRALRTAISPAPYLGSTLKTLPNGSYG